MAIRSTDLGVRMPSTPEFFSPNFDLLNQNLARNQIALDQYKDAASKIQFGALEQDALRRKQIMEQYDQGVDDNAKLFVEKGVQAGMADLNKRKREIEKLMRPGGEAYEIQENLNRYNKFVEEVNKRDDVDSVTKQKAIQYYNERFKGTKLDPNTGMYSQFQSSPLAKNVDIYEEIDKKVKGFKEDITGTGGSIIATSGPNKGYIITYKNKRGEVKEKDIRDFAYDVVGSNKDIGAMLQQRQLFGMQTEVDQAKELKGYVDAAALKYGFVHDEKYSSITGESDEMKRARKRAEIDYEKAVENPEIYTGVYKINSGAMTFKPNDFTYQDGAIRKSWTGFTSDKDSGGTGEKYSWKQVMANPELRAKVKKQWGDDRFNQAMDLYGYISSHTDVSRMSDQQLQDMMGKMSESRANFMNSRRGVIEMYSDAKQQKERREAVIGPTGDNNVSGNITRKMMVEITPDGSVGQPITYNQMLDDIGKEPSEFKKNANILGEMRVDNALSPSGEHLVYHDEDGQHKEYMIVDNSIQDVQQKRGFFDATRAISNFNSPSDVSQGQVGGFNVVVMREDQFFPDGTYDDKGSVLVGIDDPKYVPQSDEEKAISDKLGGLRPITLDQLMQLQKSTEVEYK